MNDHNWIAAAHTESMKTLPPCGGADNHMHNSRKTQTTWFYWITVLIVNNYMSCSFMGSLTDINITSEQMHAVYYELYFILLITGLWKKQKTCKWLNCIVHYLYFILLVSHFILFVFLVLCVEDLVHTCENQVYSESESKKKRQLTLDS